MTFADELNRVLKYIHWDHGDFLGHLMDSEDAAPHGAYADYLQGSDDPDERELGERLSKEVQRQLTDGLPAPPEVPDEYSSVDHTLHSLATSHKKPLVRLLAQREIEAEHGDHGTRRQLIDFLLGHDSTRDPAAHDIAIHLHPADGAIHPAARHTLRVLSGNPYQHYGLDTKTVQGVVHLRDTEDPHPEAHNSPRILFHVDASSPDEVRKLLDFANTTVAAKRNHEETAETPIPLEAPPLTAGGSPYATPYR
jgi:hypothetical protein